MKAFMVPDWKIEDIKNCARAYVNNPTDANTLLLGVAIGRLEEPEHEIDLSENHLLALLLRKPGTTKAIELKYPKKGGVAR